MVNEMEEKAYSKKKIDKTIWDVDEPSTAAAPAPAIPDDLKCPVCQDLLKVGWTQKHFHGSVHSGWNEKTIQILTPINTTSFKDALP